MWPWNSPEVTAWGGWPQLVCLPFLGQGDTRDHLVSIWDLLGPFSTVRDGFGAVSVLSGSSACRVALTQHDGDWRQ